MKANQGLSSFIILALCSAIGSSNGLSVKDKGNDRLHLGTALLGSPAVGEFVQNLRVANPHQEDVALTEGTEAIENQQVDVRFLFISKFPRVFTYTVRVIVKP